MKSFRRFRSGNFLEEPGPGVGPIIFHCAHRNAESVGNLVMGQADEITQLHHFGFSWVCGCELLERLARVLDYEMELV